MVGEILRLAVKACRKGNSFLLADTGSSMPQGKRYHGMHYIRTVNGCFQNFPLGFGQRNPIFCYITIKYAQLRTGTT